MKRIFPKMGDNTIAMVVEGSKKAQSTYALNTVNRLAAFIAQTAHESAGFTASVENLNYGSAGLRATFPKYFPTDALANAYARQPIKIASRVYADRMGNGDEASQDGWKFRGHGWIQITGHDNTAAFAKSINMSVDDALAYLLTPEGGFMGAGWFWNVNGLNALADKGDITTISKRINGGENGLAQRIAIYGAAQKALALS